MVRTNTEELAEERRWKDRVLMSLRAMGFDVSHEIDTRVGRIAQEFRGGKLPKVNYVIESLVSGLLGGERASAEEPTKRSSTKRSPRRTATRSLLSQSESEEDSSDSEEEDPSFAGDSSSSDERPLTRAWETSKDRLQEGAVSSAHGQESMPKSSIKEVPERKVAEPRRARGPMAVQVCSISAGKRRATKAPAGKENQGEPQLAGRQAPNPREPAISLSSIHTRSWISAGGGKAHRKTCEKPGPTGQGRLALPSRSAPTGASLPAALQARTPGVNATQKQVAQVPTSATAGCSVANQGGHLSHLQEKGVLVGRRALQLMAGAEEAEERPARPLQHQSQKQEGRKGQQEQGPSTQDIACSQEKAHGGDPGSQGGGGTFVQSKGLDSQREGVMGSKRLPVMDLSSDFGSSHGNRRPSGVRATRGPCGKKKKPLLEVIVHPSPSPFRGQYPFDMGAARVVAGDQENLEAKFQEASAGLERKALQEGPSEAWESCSGVPEVPAEGLVDGAQQMPEQQCKPLGGISQFGFNAEVRAESSNNLWLLAGTALLDAVGKANDCIEEMWPVEEGSRVTARLPLGQISKNKASPGPALQAPSAPGEAESCPLDSSPTSTAALLQPLIKAEADRAPSHSSPAPALHVWRQPCSQGAAATLTLPEAQQGMATQSPEGHAPDATGSNTVVPVSPARPGCGQTAAEVPCASGSQAACAMPKGDVPSAVPSGKEASEEEAMVPVLQRAIKSEDVTPAQSATEGAGGGGTSADLRSCDEVVGQTCSQVLLDAEADSGQAPNYLSDCTEAEELDLEGGKSEEPAGAQGGAVEEVSTHEGMASVPTSALDQPSTMEPWLDMQGGSQSPDRLTTFCNPAACSTESVLLQSPKPAAQHISEPEAPRCSSPAGLAETEMASARPSAWAQQGLTQPTEKPGVSCQSSVKLSRWHQEHPANIAARAAAMGNATQGGVTADGVSPSAAAAGQLCAGGAPAPVSGHVHLQNPPVRKKRRFTEKAPQQTEMAFPQAPAMALPDTPAMAPPDAPAVASPHAPAVALPDVPAMALPVATETPLSDVPAMGLSDAPAMALPDVPAMALADAPATSLSDVPAMALPGAPARAPPVAEAAQCQAVPSASLGTAEVSVKKEHPPATQELAAQQPAMPGPFQNGRLATPDAPEEDPTLLATPTLPRSLSAGLPFGSPWYLSSSTPGPGIGSTPVHLPSQPQAQGHPGIPQAASWSTMAQAGTHAWHRGIPAPHPPPSSYLPERPKLPPLAPIPCPPVRPSPTLASYPTAWQHADMHGTAWQQPAHVGWRDAVHDHTGAPLILPLPQFAPGFAPAGDHLRPTMPMYQVHVAHDPGAGVPGHFPHALHAVPERAAAPPPAPPLGSMPAGVAGRLVMPPPQCHYRHDFQTGYSVVQSPPSFGARQGHIPTSGTGHWHAPESQYAPLDFNPRPGPPITSQPSSGWDATVPQASSHDYWSGSYYGLQESYSQPQEHSSYAHPYQHHEHHNHLYQHHEHHVHSA